MTADQNSYSTCQPNMPNLPSSYLKIQNWKNHNSELITTISSPLQKDVEAEKQLILIRNHFYEMLGQKDCCAETLAWMYEDSLGKKNTKRKNTGVYYTPKTVVELIVKESVGYLLKQADEYSHPIRILDPACGSGLFLLRAYQLLLEPYFMHDTVEQKHQRLEEKWRLLRSHIYGVDIDPYAIEVTKLLLILECLRGLPLETIVDWLQKNSLKFLMRELGANIRCGNALTALDGSGTSAVELDSSFYPFDWKRSFADVLNHGGFDAVIGNPPYIDSEWMKRHQPRWREYCQRHYHCAAGNWDLYCVFLEQGMRLCKPDGILSMIVPNKLRSAHYAKHTRQFLAEKNRLLKMHDFSNLRLFHASVYPIVIVAQKSKGDEFCSPLAFLSCKQSQSEILERISKNRPCLSDISTIRGAATVREAYEIQPFIQESQQSENELQLVNSGTIDRYLDLWGTKPCRYLGDNYEKPVVPQLDWKRLPPKRLQQAQNPKIIVAGITKRLECALDAKGTILAGKSTSIILSDWDLRLLLGILNSRLVNFYFQNVYNGNRLQGGYLRIGPPQLKTTPMPMVESVKEEKTSGTIIQKVDELSRLYRKHLQTKLQYKEEQIQLQIDVLEKQIDSHVYELYGVGEEEIEVVEADA